MGSSSSADKGPVIGHNRTGKKAFYESDRAWIQALINRKVLKSTKEQFDSYWGQVDGITYYKRPNKVAYAFKKWFTDNKQSLIGALTATGKLAAGVAINIADIAVPILAKSGVAAATTAIAVKLTPAAAAVAGPVLAKLEQQLSGVYGQVMNGVKDNFYGDRPTTGSADDVSGDPFDIVEYEERCAYEGAAQSFLGVSGAYEGSCGCGGGRNHTDMFGGDGFTDVELSTIAEYTNSANEKTKEKIIDDIIEAVNKLGFRADGADKQEKLRNIMKQIPAGDKFKTAEASHINICKKIADVVNKIYGFNAINKDNKPEDICKQVYETLHSFATGVHSEFLSVYGDAANVLSNLQVLRKLLEETKEQEDDVVASNDALAAKSASPHSKTIKSILNEIGRQITLLQNLLNVQLTPVDKQIKKLLNEARDKREKIIKYEIKPGNQQMSEFLSELLKHFVTTGVVTSLVDEALKSVGMSVQEYKNTKSIEELREKVLNQVIGKNLSDEKTEEILADAELLSKNFYRSNDIANILEDREKEKTGRYEMDSTTTGGADEYRSTVIDRRIKSREAVKKLIFNAFYKSINGIFESIVSSIDIISKKIGSEIPLSDQLDGFRSIVQRINESLVSNKNIYYALIGYYNDALSKSKKETFVGELKMVKSFIESIMEMSLYKSSSHYFKDLHSNISKLVETIDKYSDEIAAKFGRGEEAEGCQYIEGSFNGGNQVGIDGGDEVDGAADFIPEPTYIKRGTTNIQTAFKQFDYYYRVAQIKSNLARTAKEIDHYSENYEKIVASSVFDILEKDKALYETYKKKLESIDLTGVDAIVGATADELKKQKESAVAFLESQWEVKKKFWATIEAVDSYMKVFTDGLVKNPKDIQDIKSMLSEVSTIEDWYNDQVGNELAGVFDHFPKEVANQGIAAADRTLPHQSYREDTRTHYYDKIGQQVAAAADARPGNPHLVTLPDAATSARTQAKRLFMKFGALKNLLSVFVSIGNKFGGEEIRKQVFMSPTQIYNNIVEFVQASAFTQGFGIGAVTADIAQWTHSDDLTGVAKELKLGDGTLADSTANGTYNGIESVRIGVASDAPGAINGAAAAGTPQYRWLNFLKLGGVWMRSVNEGILAQEMWGFKREDEYLVLMLKSIAAKVFTVTGMYDVFDRPLESNSFNAIRMIIGGDDSIPKIDDNAVELYLRLPLLLQFYYQIFGYDEDASSWKEYPNIPRADKHLKISMVPDVDGPFSGLIRLLFRKTKNVRDNSYSDDEIKELIKEVNLVYQRMQAKHPQNTVMETIHELIAEMNRRYAIISKDERDKYENEFGYRYDYGVDSNDANAYDRYGVAADTDVALLPGEGEEEIERLSPAQRLLSASADPARAKKLSGFTITNDHKSLVYRFRCAIDKYFEDSNEEYTFKNAIKAAQMKLKREQRDEERLKIVSSLIRGVDIYSKVDSMKYIMFHETVVSGLNVLSAIHTMLSRFRRRTLYIDIHHFQEAILTQLSQRGAGLITMGTLKDAVKDVITAYQLSPDAELDAHLDALFGRKEASKLNGGNMDHGVANFELNMLQGGANVPRLGGLLNVVAITGAQNAAFSKGASKLAFSVANNEAANPMSNNHGLLSLLEGFGVEELRATLKSNKNTPAKMAIDTVYRYLFDKNYVMRELIETCFGISHDSQGMVDLKLDDGKLYLNFGPLKKTVEGMFGHINYFIDLLRPYITPDLFNKYVSKTTPGSYYWLYEQIMEKIVNGRPRQEPTFGRHIAYLNLEDLGKKLSDTYQELTREYVVDGSGLIAAGAKSAVHPVNSSRDSFGRLFADLVFYDAAKPNSGLIRSSEAPDVRDFATVGGLKTVDFKTNPYEALHVNNNNGTKTIDTRYLARFHQLYTWKDELTLNRSSLMLFNQLVAKYIQQFYDVASQKIYINTINSFANGVFNRNITDLEFTFPDTAPLLAVKTSGEGASKFPNANLIRSDIMQLPQNGGFTDDDLDELASAIYALTSSGIEPNQSQATRATLLRPANSPLFGVTNGVTNMYIVMAIAVVAKAVQRAIKLLQPNRAAVINNALAANPAALVNFVASTMIYTNPPVAGAPALVNNTLAGVLANTLGNNATIAELSDYFNSEGDFGPDAVAALPVANAEAINLPRGYLAAPVAAVRRKPAVPALGDIIHKLLGVGTNLAARLDNARQKLVAVWAPNADFSAGGASTLVPAAAAEPELIPAQHALDALRERITNAVGANATYTQVPRLAAELNVANLDNMLDDSSMTKSRLLASIVYFLAGKAKSNAGDVDAATRRAVIDKINGVPQTFGAPVSVEPKFLLKHEDAANINTDDIANDIAMMFNETGYLRLARDEADGDMMQPGSWKKLGVNKQGDMKLNAVKEFGQRLDPDGEHVLFTSLAVILRNLTTSRDKSALVYANDTIADVTLYMKERFRANMPAFKLLFKELIARCDLIKRFIGRSELDLSRTYTGVAPAHNPFPFNLKPIAADNSGGKNRFTGVLEAISRGCTALVGACDQVLREVGDDPKYFELYQNSIKDYRGQYGVDPFMPMSSMLAVLKNTTVANQSDFLPLHNLGETQFKFLYGVRLLLNSPHVQPGMEHNPGFAQIVEGFNIITDARSQADKSHVDNYTKDFVKLLRFIHGAKHVKGNVSSYISRFLHPNDSAVGLDTNAATRLLVDGLFTRDNLVDEKTRRSDAGTQKAVPAAAAVATSDPAEFLVPITNKAEVSIVVDKNGRPAFAGANPQDFTIPAYSVAKNLEEVVKLTESSFRDDKIKEFVEYLRSDGKKRNNLYIQNIIDLNVIPINVHALMREVPLVNLYNYAYTFDRLIIELYYGLQNRNAQKLITELCGDDDYTGTLRSITSAKDMLVALLLKPYMQLFGKSDDGSDYYEKFVKPIMTGAVGGELGRPKFLSDQIHNKAVFGEVYVSRDQYNEHGPSGAQVNADKLTPGFYAGLTDSLLRLLMQSVNNTPNYGQMVAVGLNTNGLIKRIAKYVSEHSTNTVALRALIDTDLNANNVAAAGMGDHMRDFLSVAGMCVSDLVKDVVNDAFRYGFSGTATTRAAQAVRQLFQFFELAHVNVGGAYMGVAATKAAVTAAINRAGVKKGDVVNIIERHAARFVGRAPPAAGANAVAPVTENAINGLFKNVFSTISTNETADNTLTNYTRNGTLHYLTEGNVQALPDDHEGVGYQPDNENVVDSSQVKEVNVDAIRDVLYVVGRLRFDTVFIRNLFFIVNLYRSVRMKLSQDLMYNKEVIARSQSITKPSLTEFYGNSIYPSSRGRSVHTPPYYHRRYQDKTI